MLREAALCSGTNSLLTRCCSCFSYSLSPASPPASPTPLRQPTACIQFTSHSVLVGTTKFYEIDLKNFSAEGWFTLFVLFLSWITRSFSLPEFLDLSHPGIKETVGSQAFSGSLPR